MVCMAEEMEEGGSYLYSALTGTHNEQNEESAGVVPKEKMESAV